MAIPFHPSQVDADQLESYLRQLFVIGDQNKDGVLQPAEMAKLLKMCGFGLSASEILEVLEKADLNGDGVIQYEEFVPAAVEILVSTPVSEEVAVQATTQLLGDINWATVSESELETYVTNLFSIADENKDGVLQPKEFVKLMRMSGLNFPDDLILEGFLEADQNQDGAIQYEEFVPVVVDIVRAAKQQQDDEEIPFSPASVDQSQLESYLQQLFAIGDENKDGVLEPREMIKLLDSCGFPISAGGMLDLIAMADLNGDGVIEYAEFVPAAVAVLQAMAEEEEDEEIARALAADVARREQGTWHEDTSPEELDLYLRELFGIADENDDGALQPQEFVKLMRASGWNFPDEMILDAFIECDVNQDGEISFQELLSTVMELLMDVSESESESESEVEQMKEPNGWMGRFGAAAYRQGLRTDNGVAHMI
eukprot:TRINITY_DN5061_c0_g1_i1.p1 TRINITY_DN5061_c0_g1~~TRINITY_DN5061_c0_g1_i1.p1  ORF type:complete len:426 (-),score=148.90 TRINITY_DN5061_c0_g1_i1:263-1540(-)